MADEPENLTLLHLRAIDIKAWPRTCARSRPGLASWSSSTPRSRPASTTSMPGSIASESARSVPRHVAWGKNKTALEREGPQGDQAAKSTTLRICKLSRAVRASTPWSAFNFSVRIPLLVVFNVTTSDVPKSIRCHSTPRGDIPVQRQFPPHRRPARLLRQGAHARLLATDRASPSMSTVSLAQPGELSGQSRRRRGPGQDTRRALALCRR
jgi:hypothetical protein